MRKNSAANANPLGQSAEHTERAKHVTDRATLPLPHFQAAANTFAQWIPPAPEREMHQNLW